MTDTEKLDAIYKMVHEIRQYVGSRPDCPQNLWTDERCAYEAARQAAKLRYGASTSLYNIQNEPPTLTGQKLPGQK